MSIWMDITNISTFQGGIVGIIRAELEIAYNLAKLSEEVRFCRLDEKGLGIEEVLRPDLDWLLAAPTPVEGFLSRLKQSSERRSSGSAMPSQLYALHESASRMGHAELAVANLLSLLPDTLARPIFRALRWMLRASSAPAAPAAPAADMGKDGAGGAVQKSVAGHPFVAGDVVFACGWKDSNKENVYARIRQSLGCELGVSYLIYDTIPINLKTKFLYDQEAERSFLAYFKWIALNADLIFYGGNNARLDSQAMQKKLDLPVPPGIALRFGDTPNEALVPLAEQAQMGLLKCLGLQSMQYLLCVGSIEPRKNHDILYKAYRELLDHPQKYGLRQGMALPKLVIVGGLHGDESLVYALKNDPKVRDLVVFLRPSDVELDTLYRHCRFTLMPTLYEGWNLTLPESLSYTKFCISSDVPPMREIGEGMIEFADPFDTLAWARLIALYVCDDAALQKMEVGIRRQWHNYSWRETAESILAGLTGFDFNANRNLPRSTLWFDLSLTNNLYGRLDGIPRVELSMAWELFHKPNLNVRYFEFQAEGDSGRFIELAPEILPWLNKQKSEYADFYHVHMDYKHALLESARLNR